MQSILADEAVRPARRPLPKRQPGLGGSAGALEPGDGDFRYVDAAGNEYRYRVEGDGRAVVTSCRAAASEVRVPEALGGHAVAAIGDDAFSSMGGSSMAARVALFANGGARSSSRAGASSARNAQLERVVLPEGVVSLGRAAFRGCSKLSRVELPGTLEEIGELAFSCTVLEELVLPARCTRLAAWSLRLGPETVKRADTPYDCKLARIGVQPGNPRFCMSGGVLCERAGDGLLAAVLCPARADAVSLGPDVARVAPGAFAGTGHIGKLGLREGIEVEHPGGILPGGRCDEISVELACPKDGASRLQLRLPQGPAAGRILACACHDGKVCAESLAEAYDRELPGLEDRLEQSKLMIARLAAPVLLDAGLRAAFEEAVERDFATICVHFGARSYWEGFECMADAGLLDAARVTETVSLLTSRGDTPAAAYLLDMKRTRFGKATWDYGL